MAHTSYNMCPCAYVHNLQVTWNELSSYVAINGILINSFDLRCENVSYIYTCTCTYIYIYMLASYVLASCVAISQLNGQHMDYLVACYIVVLYVFFIG